ncbi:Protein CBG26815 [Caenorhabditis briggsae]|uniref:Protein CBG26815 n=1 Tax=Caenorhabditis briggsae TaxID=6238 RepID=B6IJT4_CAEBR|nr:Protein CBG26815 [Caenorhabditis briggsae]CAS00164.1 Protein CBG26815 [Caenorhabditis briggsae]
MELAEINKKLDKLLLENKPPNSQILDLERRLKIYSNAFEEEREKNERLQKLCNSQLTKIEELEKELSNFKGHPTVPLVTQDLQNLSKTQKKKEKAKLRNQKKQEIPEVSNSGTSENSHSPKQIIEYFREIGFLQNPETSKIPDIENESDQDYFARLHSIWAGENSSEKSDGSNLQ